MARFHLAQANIGRFRAPIDDPIMEGFRSQLDPINALADSTPGFVWRLQTEDGNATPGHIPTVDEAKQRLEILRARGPSPDAFTFRKPFPAPDGEAESGLDAAFCDWAS
jgi:hypothetical protein